MTPLLATALAYARRGWRVFPVHSVEITDAGEVWCSCGRPNCGDKGKHPRTKRGVRDASVDESTIRTWWTDWPNANIALATGAESGVVAVDVDPRHGGDVTLANLERDHAPIPPTVEGATGGGGRHIIFQHPGPGLLRNQQNRKNGQEPDGIDLKTDGGYIVLPPSLHKSDRRYEWALGRSPDEIALAPMPEWLVGWLQARATREGSAAAPTSGPTPGAPILEGARNSTLTSLAGTMRRRGMTVEEITAALQVVNQGRCRPPLPEEDIVRIAQSVSQYAPADHAPESSEKVAAFFATIRTLHDRIERPTEFPHPLIPNFVWPKTICMIVGPTGVGKTTFIVNLALRALGTRGVSDPTGPLGAHMVNMDEGLPYPARPLRVLYIGAEDSLEIFEHERLKPRLLEQYAVVPEARGRFQYLLGRVTLAAPRREDVQLEALIQRITSREPFDLLFLDPFTRFHLGFNENDNGEMAQVMAALDALRERTGAAVIFAHHTGKFGSRMISGSTAVRSDPTVARGASVLTDQSHAVYSLAKGRGGTLVLTAAKLNYAPLPRPLVFERSESGVLVPVAGDVRLDQVRDLTAKLGKGDPVERTRVVKAVEDALGVKTRQARKVVGQAEESGYVIRVTADGELSDDGRFLAVPQ